jgi:hypothetical protein
MSFPGHRLHVTPANSLPRGLVGDACLQILHEHQELTTREVAELITGRFGLTFDDKAALRTFVLTVSQALRRHTEKGILEIAGRDGPNGAIRWRAKTGS